MTLAWMKTNQAYKIIIYTYEGKIPIQQFTLASLCVSWIKPTTEKLLIARFLSSWVLRDYLEERK